MPLVYTKEEIKQYLGDRGFDIDDEELINNFIRDLKRMVKYDDRQRRRQRLGHESVDTNLESTGATPLPSHYTPVSVSRSHHEPKPRQGRTPEVNHDKNESIPSAFGSKRVGPKKRNNASATESAQVESEERRHFESSPSSSESALDQNRPKQIDETSELLYVLGHLLGEEEKEKEFEKEVERTKPMEAPNSVKRDPVALYHFYKAIWDKHSFPGENRHMQLRWTVRAQTVGNYPCSSEGVPIQYLKPQRFSSKSASGRAQSSTSNEFRPLCRRFCY